jgi:hypothetical protein
MVYAQNMAVARTFVWVVQALCKAKAACDGYGCLQLGQLHLHNISDLAADLVSSLPLLLSPSLSLEACANL